MKAMILAAGRGERLRPLTDSVPKPLVQVGGVPLIHHAIHRLRTAGVTDLVINLGYRGAQISQALGDGRDLGVTIQYSEEGEPPLETGGGIFHALPLLGSAPFLLVNADVFSEFNFAPLVAQARALTARDLAYLVLVPNPAHRPEGDFALIGDRVLLDGESRYTYSGLSILRPELFCNSEPGRFSLAPLLRHAAACDQLGGELFDGMWSDVGTPERHASLDARLTQQGR